MHIPRTAGKTCFSCFLKSAIPPSHRCLKAYDGPRLALNDPSCRLISSHDDYSLTQDLAPGVAVVTQLRRPVQRVLSAYEFAVSVAAETLLADLQREADVAGRPHAWIRFRTKQGKEYWWNREQNITSWTTPASTAALDPYDNPLVMPLAEWIEHPIARELVHEGAALQVLGLSNASAWGVEAARLRRCFFADRGTHKALTRAALARAAALPATGVVERLDDSIAVLSKALGLPLTLSAYRNLDDWAVSFDPVGGADPQTLLSISGAQQPQLAALVDRESDWLAAHPGSGPQASPWSAEIEALDAAVSAGQRRLQGLVASLDALAEGGALTRLVEAQGPSVQIVPDAHYLLPEPLGHAYVRCARKQQDAARGTGPPVASTPKQRERRPPGEGFPHLHTPAELDSFAFTGEARRRLPAPLQRRIRELNAADGALWAAADARLGERGAAGAELPQRIAPQLGARGPGSKAPPRSLASDPGFKLGIRSGAAQHDEL